MKLLILSLTIVSIFFVGYLVYAQSCTDPVCISSIQVTNITTNSATIIWTTNVSATSQVKYGPTVRNLLSTPVNNNATTNHSITITGLNPSFQYVYQVESIANGFTARSNVGQFTTQSPASNDPVVISAEAVNNITMDSVTVTWRTNVPTTTQVEYGPTTRYGLTTPVNSNSTTSHSVTLTGLNLGATYNYRALSTANGFTARGTNRQFTTQGAPCTDSVCISNVLVTNITNSGATITWKTNVPATTQVNYGPTPRYGLSTPLNNNPVTDHSVPITGLNPGFTYNFQVISTSVTHNFTARSSNHIFTAGGRIGQPSGGPGQDVSGGFKITSPWAGVNNIFDLLDKITDFLLNVSVPIAVILIIYAGVLFLTSAGNTARIGQAKNILWYTILGFAVILIGKGFYLLIESILNLQ